MNPVQVVANQLGNVISVSENNPDYGYIRVVQVAPQYNEQGWLRLSKRSALIKGLVNDLVEMNFKEGDVIPGKIVCKESLTPFNQMNPERDLKIAGDTGVICRVDDQPIYRQTFYTPNTSAQDELIMHNNSDEIREVQSAQRSLKQVVRSVEL